MLSKCGNLSPRGVGGCLCKAYSSHLLNRAAASLRKHISIKQCATVVLVSNPHSVSCISQVRRQTDTKQMIWSEAGHLIGSELELSLEEMNDLNRQFS